MEQKEIIIKINNEEILLNPTLPLSIENTNIPFKHLTFRIHRQIFWKVRMIGYTNDSKCLKVGVIDYDLENTTGFETQESKKEVRQLLFEKFDWIKLEPILSSYQKSELNEILFNINAKPFSKGNVNLFKIEFDKIENQIAIETRNIEYKPKTRILNEEFWVSFNDAQFMLGYVSFKKHIEKLNRNLDFKIENDHILAEFDNIKNWFSKKLETKKFIVSAKITLVGDIITDITATSRHINLINQELIDGVKYQRTLNITKEPKINMPDKALYTADEIFNQTNTNDIEGNVFNQSEQDILDFFLNVKNVKNKKQLAYLSGKKQSTNHIIRYTLSPNFGFLFLIEGEKNNHFIWELLETHATYVWSIEKSEINLKL